MRLWRVFPWDPRAARGGAGDALHAPRELQGAGRHDNPHLYGVLYLSERPMAGVAEAIAHLRGASLEDADLERFGLRLALAPLDGALEGRLWDLDEPSTLVERSLRPSVVATRARDVTQRWAADLFRVRPRRGGLRWWSTLEASWLHVTLFDRAIPRLSLGADPEPLRVSHPAVREAAEALGIRVR